MSYVFVGLGNPGDEYKNTRHNVGRIILDYFRKEKDFSDWEESAKYKSIISSGKIGSKKVLIMLPETFMNKSGDAVRKAVLNKKQAESLVVIHDDLDLPIGTKKISWERGSGGHKGVDAIVRALKTNSFVRVRVGISPSTPKGKVKKPKGEAVEKCILGEFKSAEISELKKLSKKIIPALESFVLEGREKMLSSWNN